MDSSPRRSRSARRSRLEVVVFAASLAASGAIACGGDDAPASSSAAPSAASAGGSAPAGSGGSASSASQAGGADATSTSTSTTSAASAAGGASSAGGGGPTADELFASTVEADLVQTCGVCHQGASFDVNFLDAPTYATLHGWVSKILGEPFIVKPASKSPLLTYPDTSAHTDVGKAWTTFPDLKSRVEAWLEKEAEALVDPPPPPPDRLPVFTPKVGLNVVSLEPFGPRFAGSSLTFVAEPLGAPASLLKLEALHVYPAAGTAIRMVHPRFDVRPPGSQELEPDPVDSFAEVDQTFVPPKGAPLGAGELILANWVEGAGLTLDFELGRIDPLIVDPAGNVVSACKDPALYRKVVQSLATGNNGPQLCADKCHGGSEPAAFAKMNLSSLLGSPPDYELACAHMRTKIAPGDPEASAILIVTKPGSSTPVPHLFKFNGNSGLYNQFKTEMTPWILAEQ